MSETLGLFPRIDGHIASFRAAAWGGELPLDTISVGPWVL